MNRQDREIELQKHIANAVRRSDAAFYDKYFPRKPAASEQESIGHNGGPPLDDR